MLAMHSATLSYAGAVAPVAMRVSAPMMESKAELEALAKKLNPIVGYWDPMNLVDYDQFSAGQEASIGFLRQAEIKHGRVAMAAFVGYIVQSNGIHFPWALTTSGVTYADISAAGSPPDQWDALPTASKVQILCFIGILEICSESKYILEQDGKAHYMSGGKPGAFPSIKKVMPHPVPFGTRPHHYPPALLQNRRCAPALPRPLLQRGGRPKGQKWKLPRSQDWERWLLRSRRSKAAVLSRQQWTGRRIVAKKPVASSRATCRRPSQCSSRPLKTVAGKTCRRLIVAEARSALAQLSLLLPSHII